MNINELTISQLKEHLQQADEIRATLSMQPTRQGAASVDDSHWVVGDAYFIRTVTHHLVGKLEKVTAQELVLSGAAWVADDGRFNETIAKGTVSEVEPYPDDALVIVGRGSLIDATKWRFPLLRVIK